LFETVRQISLDRLISSSITFEALNEKFRQFCAICSGKRECFFSHSKICQRHVINIADEAIGASPAKVVGPGGSWRNSKEGKVAWVPAQGQPAWRVILDKIAGAPDKYGPPNIIVLPKAVAA
jgi:hypothetical protein